MEKNSTVPILMPYEPAEFWGLLRQIVQEEVRQLQVPKKPAVNTFNYTPGLTEKPLYTTGEICQLFKVSRSTVYEWVKLGKLRKVKVRSRAYFVGYEVQQLLL